MKSLSPPCKLLLVALSSLWTALPTTEAFVPVGPTSAGVSSRSQSQRLHQAIHSVPGSGYDPTAGGLPPPPAAADDDVDMILADMFPMDIPMRKMQGGGTVRTWDIPPEAERLYYYIRTNGRPLKALVELWVGPIRRIHSVNIENEDGAMTPYRAMLKFKPGTKTLKISTEGSHEFPLEFGAEVPNMVKFKQSWKATQAVFDAGPKTIVQGGSTEGGGGSVRYFNIPDTVESVQMVLWSRDLGKRTVKAKIEVLQGPNSIRQLYDLHCGGSTQPYHAIIPTPGTGWTIRVIATNYMEFPFEAVVTPYEEIDPNDRYGGFYGPNSYDLGSGDWHGPDRTTGNSNLSGKSNWWEK